MPFDLGIVDDVLSLKSEIVTLARRPDILRTCSEFSAWKIFPSKKEKIAYRLARHTNRAQFDRDGGYYLTNLVLQGGGTLGLAHAGFIAGLEEAGFRFPAIAGTSAGAIIAAGMFAARGDNILNSVSPTVTELVSEVPMDTFVDGPRSIRRVLKKFAAQRRFTAPLYWPGLLAVVRQLLRVRGLNSGHVFEHWMRDNVFRPYDLDSIKALNERMAKIADDLGRAECHLKTTPFNQEHSLENWVLKLIATAMPTGMKFRLPEDLRLLHPEYQDISPARLVRMSMSIPLFFEPVEMQTNPETWAAHVFENLEPFVSDRTAWEMAELSKLTFLDGGLFSNLPTDELVRGMSEDIACISVPLVSSDTNVTVRRANSLGELGSEAAAVINAIRLQRDREAHSRMMDEQPNKCVLKIDTDRAHWLNFTMSAAEKEELFLAGLERVRNMLRDGDLRNA